jgi:uncharacterized membrane protein YraQ (UPF0718 family)
MVADCFSMSVRRAALLDPVYAAVTPLAILGALVVYKSQASIAAIQKTSAQGSLEVRPDVIEFGSRALSVAFEHALNYGIVILPALIFGILIGAAVRTFVRPDWLIRALRGNGIGGQLRAAAAGSPMMLCSCCVAPVFSATYEKGLRLASSITLMLASPSLNPAALVLTFMLLPMETAVARLVIAVLVVLGAGVLIEASRTFASERSIAPSSSRCLRASAMRRSVSLAPWVASSCRPCPSSRSASSAR